MRAQRAVRRARSGAPIKNGTVRCRFLWAGAAASACSRIARRRLREAGAIKLAAQQVVAELEGIEEVLVCLVVRGVQLSDLSLDVLLRL